ncbi:MICOS complex subunit MIC25 isoform X3 [Hippopotamus amphibius kiboko]|uniref:MICOS complex subunit MIC25 isoform X3 n=1 Tax=Hippopotamus amphibius kiboko TaxID=575201 RepID=UPI00259166C6|nr:MICOS complex subunit MIC25 isoform X3 [Hippopotamus amphibius kiboko]
MGSAESREGRGAPSAMDEEERVRVLQGIRLSENVVNRMKDPGQPARVALSAPPAAALGSSEGQEKGQGAGKPRGGAETPRRLLQGAAGAPGEAGAGLWSSSLFLWRVQASSPPILRPGGEGGIPPVGTAEEGAREHSPFPGARLCGPRAGVSLQNVETYRLSSQQFHEAASKVEGAIRGDLRPRSWPGSDLEPEEGTRRGTTGQRRPSTVSLRAPPRPPCRGRSVCAPSADK